MFVQCATKFGTLINSLKISLVIAVLCEYEFLFIYFFADKIHMLITDINLMIKREKETSINANLIRIDINDMKSIFTINILTGKFYSKL